MHLRYWALIEYSFKQRAFELRDRRGGKCSGTRVGEKVTKYHEILFLFNWRIKSPWQHIYLIRADTHTRARFCSIHLSRAKNTHHRVTRRALCAANLQLQHDGLAIKMGGLAYQFHAVRTASALQRIKEGRVKLELRKSDWGLADSRG